MSDTTAQPKRYGVLIASSSFPDEPKLHDLNCPENDVDGLYEVLTDDSIGAFSELQVVKNEPSHTALRKVHQVLRKAGRDDFVLIYYAGHGKTDLAGRLHLATTETVTDELETTSIPAQRIRTLIDNARTTKVALILDCCYSGAIEKSFLRGSVEDQLNIMAGGRGTFIMTASTDVQTAREEVREGYGIFTKHLIDGIRGEADVDGNGIVTMNELYDYVHREVMADSHQEPMKWNLNVQGEMVIAQSGRKPREERRVAIREKLFALSNEGALPDLVFTKAVQVSNLSYEESRTGAASRYDALLDRLLEDDPHIGQFINDWLKVPPDDAPEPEPKPKAEPKREAEPEPETGAGPAEAPSHAGGTRHEKPADPPRPQQPAEPDVGIIWKFLVWPYPATQENLDRHPFYRILHGQAVKAREDARIAAGGKATTSWTDVAICLAWLFFATPVIAAIVEASYPDESVGVLVGAALWAGLGWVLLKRASHRINVVVKGLYWVGMVLCGGLAVLVLIANA